MKPESLSAGTMQAAQSAPAIRTAAAPLFDKILIANRGEIACRIISTARRMGIATVAVYPEADSDAHHVRLADEAVCIGAGPARESYLDMSRILDACRRTGVQAVHPGYGFLSESAEFSKRIETEGLAFIGPDHRSIAALGDKIAAKVLAAQTGGGVIAGWNAPLNSVAEAVEKVAGIGYPVMIKASAGGGGRGLRVARNEAELVEGLRSCQSEARISFGDDRVFIERLVPRARHIEVQILADAHGNCVHLWERECSIQRRHQKLIEEAPSPFLDEATRARMCEQAVALARAANYRSVGTVEFLVGEDRSFYFLEMNTRLQVEHPVTEAITGLDLVEWMIRVAAGQRLTFDQQQVARRGWALECRINADDPSRNFLPSAGRLVRYLPPAQTMEAAEPVPADGGVRVDSGMREGGTVSTFYDSMICKLIVHAADRNECIRGMREALDAFVIRGVSSNIAFHADLLANPHFQEGRFDTGFIAEHYANGFTPMARPEEQGFLMALAVAVHLRLQCRAASITGQMAGYEARVGADLAVVVRDGSGSRTVVSAWACLQDDTVHVRLDGVDYPFALAGSLRDIAVHGTLGGIPFRAQVERVGLAYQVSRNGSRLQARVMSPRAAELDATMPFRTARLQAKALLSPMAGRLMEVSVAAGQRVCAGERLAVVEAMKMENVLVANEDGVIASVMARKGENLTVDQVILQFR